MRLIALAAAIAFSGCASSTEIKTGGDDKMFLVECDGYAVPKGVCFEKANELCPNGYDIMDQERAASSMGIFNGAYVAKNIMVQCKGLNPPPA